MRKRSFERGSRLADAVRSAVEDMPEGGLCDHETPCGCYAEGYTVGRMDRHERTPVDFSRLRRLLDHVYRAAEEAGGIRLPEPQHGQSPAKE